MVRCTASALYTAASFSAQVEVDQYETARVTMGLNPFDFSWPDRR